MEVRTRSWEKSGCLDVLGVRDIVSASWYISGLKGLFAKTTVGSARAAQSPVPGDRADSCPWGQQRKVLSPGTEQNPASGDSSISCPRGQSEALSLATLASIALDLPHRCLSLTDSREFHLELSFHYPKV